MNKYLFIEKNLEKIIRSNKPVVGLELNSISKVVPYPQSLNLAMEIEDIIKSSGAYPATLGIIDGKLIAGLTSSEIAYLLSMDHAPKISTRDISYFISQKLSGTLTSAAALFISKLAGIRVLSTAAIGGVHRGAVENFDISSDLQELSSTNVAVVCSGVNYIFDIPLTLEYLKTYGVPVVGYTTDIFPAFYVLDDRLKVEYRIDHPKEIASLIDTKWNLGIKGGVIVANPVPHACVIDRETMESYVKMALEKARQSHIDRKDFTSYMIEEIDSYTKGKTMQYIGEILKNNARLSCIISEELTNLYKE